MERIDEELQARVWQRVCSREAEALPPELPCRMLSLAGDLAACYRALAAKRGGQFRSLHRQLQETRARLRTLQQFAGCREPETRRMPPKGDAQALLERCCHLERRLAEELEGRRSDPEWGPVFALMAQQARQRCLRVLALRGMAQA